MSFFTIIYKPSILSCASAAKTVTEKGIKSFSVAQYSRAVASASRFCSFQSSFSIIVAAKEVKLFQKMKILPFFGQFYREKEFSTVRRKGALLEKGRNFRPCNLLARAVFFDSLFRQFDGFRDSRFRFFFFFFNFLLLRFLRGVFSLRIH